MSKLKNFLIPQKDQVSSFKIGIKIESYFKLLHLQQIQSNNLSPLNEAYNLNLNLNCFTLKKKNKILLTTLTSPHVHKKSREQYKINCYTMCIILNLKHVQDYKNFLKFKIKLYDLYLEQGLQITLTYLKHFKIHGIL